MDELIVLLGFMMLIAIQVMIVFALVWLLRKAEGTIEHVKKQIKDKKEKGWRPF